MKTVLKYLAVVFIAVLFNIGALLSPLAMLVMPWRAGAIFRAQNRLCGAAYFGFDGSRTISATCGFNLAVNPDCQPCKALCEALSAALNQEDHCAEEAA